MKREKSKLRDEDIKLSNATTEFLEAYFYSKETTDYKKIDDTALQYCGVDSIFIFNGEKYLCDEKASIRYKNLKTFCLELSFINQNGIVQEGWLTDDKEINNSFLFVWLDDDGVEIALVKRDKILKRLESLGWTKEKLRIKCKKIRENPEEAMGDLQKYGCKFFFSKQFVEKPINVLLTREAYKNMADYTKKYYNTSIKL